MRLGFPSKKKLKWARAYKIIKFNTGFIARQSKSLKYKNFHFTFSRQHSLDIYLLPQWSGVTCKSLTWHMFHCLSIIGVVHEKLHVHAPLKKTKLPVIHTKGYITVLHSTAVCKIYTLLIYHNLYFYKLILTSTSFTALYKHTAKVT